MLNLLHLSILAADPGSKIGQNIGNMLTGFSRPIFLGVIGCVAIGLIGFRQVNKLIVFIGVALVVGILVLNPVGFGNIAKAIGDAISNGV